jgi:site-specific recombinase XerD
MGAVQQECRTLQFVVRAALVDHVQEFIIDRQARGLSSETVSWYREKLSHFTRYLTEQGTDDLASVTPTLIRQFILTYGQTHNAGGVHGVYRAVRALCRWYADEYDVANVCAKVQAPHVDLAPIEPVSLTDLTAMLTTCASKSFADLRDRAAMLFLLDSGCRRAEFLALNVGNLDMQTGAVTILRGKGGKWRMAFIGAQTRKALIGYLRVRGGPADTDPLWVTDENTRLSANGLREILRRRAKRANVQVPSPHDFRRAFCLGSLRAGVDLVSLQRLMGHSNLAVIQRYLAQNTDDLQAAHAKSSPVDRMMLGKRR